MWEVEDVGRQDGEFDSFDLGGGSVNWEDCILPKVAGVLCRLVKEVDLPKSLCALCGVLPST
jgi:hypothetical protein